MRLYSTYVCPGCGRRVAPGDFCSPCGYAAPISERARKAGQALGVVTTVVFTLLIVTGLIIYGIVREIRIWTP